MEYLTLIFYRYAKTSSPKMLAKSIYDYCIKSHLVGRILLSKEGINGTVSGTKKQCTEFIEELKSHSPFTDIEVRFSESKLPTFKDVKVKYRKQLLQFGDAENLNPLLSTGTHIDPQLFYKAIKEDSGTIILDVRNKIEHAVGKFKNAVTLDIDHFREFPGKINELEQYRDKKIIAYCTAGIRCEIATAFLKLNGFNQVYQLHGGILNYAAVKDGEDFEGRCYVFDERQTIAINKINPSEISNCKICNKTTSKIINCANAECNLLICICEECADMYEGCCSEKCKASPGKRSYEGEGYLKRLSK